LTNIGQSLQDANGQYSPNADWAVIVVSDFINMIETPAIDDALQALTAAGARVSTV
jgi:hypothetical protein